MAVVTRPRKAAHYFVGWLLLALGCASPRQDQGPRMANLPTSRSESINGQVLEGGTSRDASPECELMALVDEHTSIVHRLLGEDAAPDAIFAAKKQHAATIELRLDKVT